MFLLPIVMLSELSESAPVTPRTSEAAARIRYRESAFLVCDVQASNINDVSTGPQCELAGNTTGNLAARPRLRRSARAEINGRGSDFITYTCQKHAPPQSGQTAWIVLDVECPAGIVIDEVGQTGEIQVGAGIGA